MVEVVFKEVGEKLRVDVKVEINGVDGIKNNLIINDINEVVGIIVVVDKKVEIVCFNDRKVIVISIVDVIKNVEILIKKILNNEVFVFKVEINDKLEEDV